MSATCTQSSKLTAFLCVTGHVSPIEGSIERWQVALLHRLFLDDTGPARGQRATRVGDAQLLRSRRSEQDAVRQRCARSAAQRHISQCQLQACKLTMFVSSFTVKKTYSGKVGGRQDDLIITLQLALIGSRVFYTEPRYRNFRPVSNQKTTELL